MFLYPGSGALLSESSGAPSHLPPPTSCLLPPCVLAASSPAQRSPHLRILYLLPDARRRSRHCKRPSESYGSPRDDLHYLQGKWYSSTSTSMSRGSAFDRTRYNASEPDCSRRVKTTSGALDLLEVGSNEGEVSIHPFLSIYTSGTSVGGQPARDASLTVFLQQIGRRCLQVPVTSRCKVKMISSVVQRSSSRYGRVAGFPDGLFDARYAFYRYVRGSHARIRFQKHT